MTDAGRENRITGRDVLQVVLAATLGWLLLFGPALGPGRVPLDPSWQSDTVNQFYSWQTFTRESLDRSEFPLWNPRNGLGQPFQANPQTGLLYPLNWLHSWFPAGPASWLEVWLKVSLAALFMFLFLRRLRLSPGVALIGGVAFAFLPHFFTWLYWPWSSSELWIPLALYFTVDYLETARMRPVIYLAVVLTLQCLAGQVQTWVVTILFVSAWFVWFRSSSPAGRQGIRAVGRFFLFLPLTLVLAAPQWLPFTEYLLNSQAWAVRQHLNPSLSPVGHLVHLVLPRFFGDPAAGNWWAWTSERNLYLYAGIPILVLAVMGFTRRGRWREKVFFLGGVVLFWVFFFRHPAGVVNFLLHLTPLGMIGFGKYYVFMNICLLVPAMRMLEDWEGRRDRIGLAIVSAGVIAVALAGGIGYADFIRGLSLGGFELGNGVVLILLLLALGGVLAFWSPPRRRWPVWVLAGVVFIDFYLVDRPFTTAADPAAMLPGRAEVREFVQGDPARSRFFAPAIPPEINLVYGFDSISAYDALMPRRYARLAAGLNGPVSPETGHEPGEAALTRIDTGTLQRRWLKGLYEIYGRETMIRIIRLSPATSITRLKSPELAGVLNVGWSLTTASPRTGNPPATSLAGWDIRRYEPVLPRVSLSAAVRQVSSDEAALAALLADPARSRREPLITGDVAVDPDSGTGADAPVGQATIDAYLANRVEISTVADRPAWLILRDLYFPGWQAEIDGRPVTIRPADYAFRAVRVPAGFHQVTFTYFPDSFRAGFILGCLGLLLVIAWRLGSWYRTVTHGASTAGSGSVEETNQLGVGSGDDHR